MRHLRSDARFDAVGAGIGLGSHALKAMKLVDPTFAKMCDELKVGKTSPERQHEQIEILGAAESFGIKRGWRGGSVGHARFERSGAHRKALLQFMTKLVPQGMVRLDKRMRRLGRVGGRWGCGLRMGRQWLWMHWWSAMGLRDDE